SSALLVVEKDGGYAKLSDTIVDLRVEDHPRPLEELRRLYGLHQAIFGETPREEWLTVDDELAAELRERLANAGYNGELATAFGPNAYTARAGQRILEEHHERYGHEEMYVVLRGRARFTLGDDELEAGPGTLVFVRPATRRGAIALEDDTAVLAVGAKPGVVFEPSPWEDMFAAGSYADQGDLERARSLIDKSLAEHADEWEGHYNAACIEAKAGNAERAFEHLRRGAELNTERVAHYAREDADFDARR